MLSRRDILQAGAAAAVLLGGSGLGRAAAAQAISQSDLLRFEPIDKATFDRLWSER